MRRLFLYVLMMMAAFAAVTMARDNWDRQARQRKADYMFLQGVNTCAIDSNDTGMLLLEGASRLAPGDLDIAGEYAMAWLSLVDNPDSAGAEQAYAALRSRFAANPRDYQGGQSVASAARGMRKIDDVVWAWQTLDSLFPAKTDPAINLAGAYVARFSQNNDTADYDRAMAIYDRLERGAGKTVNLSTQKVLAFMLRGDTAAVVREMEALTGAVPADARVRLLAGSIYDNLALDSAALSNYRQAIAIDSTQAGRAYVGIANIYRQMGDSLAYDREVFQALQSPDLEFDAKYEIMRGYVSELYTDSLQWPRIDNLFAVLQQVNPGEARVHDLYGAFEIARAHYAPAAEQFAYATALDPSDPNMRMSWLRTLVTLDSIPAAVRVARDGITLFPDNLFFPIMAAEGLRSQKQYAQAIDLLNKVDISETNNPKAVSNFLTTMADTYYMADSLEKAFETYERALKLDEDNFLAYNNAAYFMAEAGRDLDKALQYAQFAVLFDPSNATYLDTYAWVYFKLKNYDEARKQIDEALTRLKAEAEATDADIDASHADVLEHAGDIYFMAGEPDKAVEFWQQAAALNPGNELLARKVKHRTYFYK